MAAQIKTDVRERSSYENRRPTVAVNHTFGTGYNPTASARKGDPSMELAAWVLEQPPQRIADSNPLAPHSNLGVRSPADYRGAHEAATGSVSWCLANRGAL